MPVSLHSVGWDWWLGAVSLLCRAGGWGCSGVQAELRMSGLESCVFSSCVLHNLLLLLFFISDRSMQFPHSRHHFGADSPILENANPFSSMYWWCKHCQLPPVKQCTDGTNTVNCPLSNNVLMVQTVPEGKLPPVKQCTNGTNTASCPLSNKVLMVQTLSTAPCQTMYWWYKHCQRVSCPLSNNVLMVQTLWTAPCQTMYWWYKLCELPPVKQCTDGTNTVNCPQSNNVLMVQTLSTAPCQTVYW